MLDVNPDALRGVAESVRDAAAALIDATESHTPSCGGDEVSQTIMDNLNARRKWLADHARTGHQQTWEAASATDDTAASFEQGDAAMADMLGGAAAGGAGTGGSSQRGGSGRSSAGLMPSTNAIPDISGRDGESLAQQLESGAGTAPAVAAAAQCSALAGKATQAATHFAGAQALLAASGTSEAHGPMLARLARAQVWAQAVAGHAQDLAESYTAAAQSHIAACGAVRSSQEWAVTKTAFTEAVAENQATGGMMQERVEALKTLLDSMQQEAVAGMGGYQSAGELFSIPDVGLLNPHVSPDGPAGAPGQSPAAAADPEIFTTPPAAGMAGTGASNLASLTGTTAAAGSARSAVQALGGALSPGAQATGGSGSSGSGPVVRPAGLSGGAAPTGNPGGAASSGAGGGMASTGSGGSSTSNSPNTSSGSNPGPGQPGGADPNQDLAAIDGSDPDDDQTDSATTHSDDDDGSQSGSGGPQNLLGPLMGAAGPAMGALGKGGGGGNPLGSLGQIAQSLEQQLGKQFGGHKGHPLTPLTHAAAHHPGSGHLGGGGAKGGGLGHLGASVHPAAAKSTPASAPPSGASGSGGQGAGAGSGMAGAGMMPMGAGGKGAKPPVKPNPYPEPIQAQPAGTGRAGIVGRDPAQADRPVLDPKQDKARRERVAQRKKAGTDNALDL